MSDRSIPKASPAALARCVVTTLLLIGAVGASWLFNMGWYRVLGTILFLPFLHAGAVLWANLAACRWRAVSPRADRLAAAMNAAYLLAYLCFPDGGDLGEVYMLFGLVKNEVLCTIGFYAAGAFLVVHLVLMAALMRECTALKHQYKPPVP